MSTRSKRQAKQDDVVRTEVHADHAILHPPQTLKAKALVAVRSGDPAPEEAVEQGEDALGSVSPSFQNWMIAETEKLAEAREQFRTEGGTSEARHVLFRACHQVRGNAGVFGFPLAGKVADSLCKLVDRCPPERLPLAVVDQHVDAIRAMVREDARGSGDPRARTLTVKLIEVTQEFLDVVAPEPGDKPRG